VSWQLAIRPDALADIEAGAVWYEKQQEGLGVEFARTIRSAISGLAANPFIYRVRERRRNVRWFLPPRFPYRIMYRVQGELITIIAVVHAARHDEEWKRRT
jgi:plasmid stabilization system protein ParE